MNLDELIDIHTKKGSKAKHYSRQLTIGLAIVSFIFFGTILGYHATESNFNTITGMATAAGSTGGFSAVGDFVTAVRTSPNVTMFKLFFYTLWIIAVLIGSAVMYEFKEV